MAIRGVLLLLALLLLAPLLIVNQWIIQLPFRLLFGWTLFLHRGISLMSWNWDTVASGGVAALLGLGAANYCGRRFISAGTGRIRW